MHHDEIVEALRRYVDPSRRDWFGERWFAGKDRAIDHVELADRFVLCKAETVGVLALVDVFFLEGEPQRYQLPCVVDSNAEVRTPEPSDALWLETVAALREERVLEGDHGVLRFRRSAAGFPLPRRCGSARSLCVDQSNTSMVLDETLLLKVFRRVEPGVNPDVEMSEFLSSRAGFERAPRVAGWIEHESSKGVASLGLFSELLPQARDGWEHALELAGDPGRREEWLDHVSSLGDLTAELHLALASRSEPPFAPEALAHGHIDALRDRVWNALEEARCPPMELPEPASERLPLLLGGGEHRGDDSPAGGLRIRVHGDYHLGQIVLSGGRSYVVDFEGEPLRTLDERRVKDSPLRDVAGMLRSFHYAICVRGRSEAAAALTDLAETRERFLDAYRGSMEGAAPSLIPPEPLSSRLLELLEFEKALYELAYESRCRPEMRAVPMSYLSRYLG